MSDKKKNYTAMQENLIIENFQSVETFEDQKALAVEIAGHPPFEEKTARQLLSKLSHLTSSRSLLKSDGSPLYIHKIYAPKVEGTTVLLKATIIAQLAILMDCEEETISSLENANKVSLLIVLGALTPAKEA